MFYVWFMVMYHISTSCVDLKKLYEKENAGVRDH